MAIPEEVLRTRLEKIENEGLMRSLRTVVQTGGVLHEGGKRVLNFSSNDYLDLANDAQVRRAASDAAMQYGGGSTASRLMSGNIELFNRLETELAGLCGTEDALLFGSGFLGNLGVLGALAQRQDAIFSDRLNHASLIDGMLLSSAKCIRYRHNDMAQLEQLLREKVPAGGMPIIVSDTVFSMDGDIAPVDDLVELSRKYHAALIVDEAHAIGIFGGGGGVLCERGLTGQADLVMGTLSKALGSYGGFGAGSSLLKRYLINRARTFIFSTGLPPAALAAGIKSIEIIRERKNIGAELLRRTRFFVGLLEERGFSCQPSASQIVPIMIGDNNKALEAAETLRGRGILATAIRPPTVPVGTARLRLSVTLAHGEDDLRAAADIIRDCL